MSAARAAIPTPTKAQPAPPDENKIVRLHITPLRPDLLKVYLAPSVLPLATNISYHAVETFPEKGFGYVELPETEAQKLRKKLNGLTLRGSKVRIEMAKSEKRKAREEADAAKDVAEAERPPKRPKKEKVKKEDGVLEGVVLPDDRKVKRGWTEPPSSKTKKERKEKKDKDKDKDKDKHSKHEQKKSKYTREPELLFKAKLTPVAATEVARKDKKDKKEKKEKSKSKSREVVVHEFEKNTKTPSFIKQTQVSTEKKPAVEYVNGQGWVDEDGNVVEPETGKARNRRVLELVDKPVEPEKKTSPATNTPKKDKKAKITRPPSPSESEADDSSVVSSSSEEEDSEGEDEDESEDEDVESEAESTASSAAPAPATDSKSTSEVPQISVSSEQKEVHPLEALFKRSKPSSEPSSTPTKKLAPIDTSFSFFENNNDDDKMEVDASAPDNAPATPYTQKDLEWRGLRSAAPTPDTAAIGRRFSFDWRKNSQEADEEEDDDDDDVDDTEAEKQLSNNTKANTHLPGLVEDNENEAGADKETEEKPESEFRKWFWENRGDINRAWKKRRRDALKAKRLSDNRKTTGGRRVV